MSDADRGEAIAVARSCLTAWSTGDLETTRALVSDEVTFSGPLGHTDGASAYLDGLARLRQIVDHVEIRAAFGEGDDVCVIYDLITKHPRVTIPTAGWYRVHEGKVAAVRAYFDARPLEGGAGPLRSDH